jgi:predicted TIM-barrel fold metal-dependent hydrolase
MVIDSDAHVVEPPDLWDRGLPGRFAGRIRCDVGPSGPTFTIDGVPLTRGRTYDHPSRQIGQEDRFRMQVARSFDPGSQLESMDREGIDVAALFPTYGLGLMGARDADPQLTAALARVYNDWLAEFCSSSPHRLVGVGMIDLRSPGDACSEAERCVQDLGFVGVFARPNPVGDRQLYASEYEDLWSTLEDLDVPICLHEGGAVFLPQVGPDRFDRHGLWHICSHPMEQQIAMVALVMGGVLARHPRLRAGFMECGAGWLPYWIHRMDEHFELDGSRDAVDLDRPPSDYVRDRCFVSIDSDEEPGVNTVRQFPNVVWGSDYPHPDGKYPHALTALESLLGLSEEDVNAIVHTSPQRLYGPPLRHHVLAASS